VVKRERMGRYEEILVESVARLDSTVASSYRRSKVKNGAGAPKHQCGNGAGVWRRASAALITPGLPVLPSKINKARPATGSGSAPSQSSSRYIRRSLSLA
jgi:hypothetical protein